MRSHEFAGGLVAFIVLAVCPVYAQEPSVTISPTVAGQSVLRLPAEDDYMKRLDNALPWKILSGKSVTLFYVAGTEGGEANDPETIRRKLEVIEEVLEQGRTLLGVEPLPFLVPVYLFPTAEAQGKAFGVKPYAGAATQFQTVTCLDGDLYHLRSYLSHEMAHILTRHRIADPLPDFLQEGVAVWVQLTILGQMPPATDGGSRLGLGVTSDKPLKAVCVLDSGKLEEAGINAHAASFVEYIISTGANPKEGMARLRAFLLAVSKATGKPEARMKAASLAVLGKDLEATEKEWRQHAPNHMIEKGWVFPNGFINLDFAKGLDEWRQFGKGNFKAKYIKEEGVVLLTIPKPMNSDAFLQGLLFQPAKAIPYRGKRLQCSLIVEGVPCNDALFTFGYAQSKEVTYYAVPLKRALVGERATYTITADIPHDAQIVQLNIHFYCPGTLRLKGFTVREVGPEVPLTPSQGRRPWPFKKQ